MEGGKAARTFFNVFAAVAKSKESLSAIANKAFRCPPPLMHWFDDYRTHPGQTIEHDSSIHFRGRCPRSACVLTEMSRCEEAEVNLPKLLFTTMLIKRSSCNAPFGSGTFDYCSGLQIYLKN